MTKKQLLKIYNKVKKSFKETSIKKPYVIPAGICYCGFDHKKEKEQAHKAHLGI